MYRDDLVENKTNIIEKGYMTQYNNIKRETTQVSKVSMRRKIINIVKENTIHNLDELNKSILDIIKVDVQFKELFKIDNNDTAN